MDGCVAINFAANSNFRGYCIVVKAIGVASQPPVDMVDLLYRAKRRGFGCDCLRDYMRSKRLL